MSEFITIVTTTNSKENAQLIGNDAINLKLAACVQLISSVNSIYRWKNEICNEEEIILMIKTTMKNKDELVRMIHKNHVYEIPEIICYNMDILNDDYRRWFKEGITEK